MQSYNPFRRYSVPYQVLKRESCETDSNKDEEGHHLLFNTNQTRRFRFPHHTCGYFLAVLISLLLGLVTGQFFRMEYSHDGYLAPYGHTPKVIRDVVWAENRTFSCEPSDTTEAAWASLLPEGRGFIQHPKLGNNEMKSVSVFHELHCLHGIRTAYFTADYQLRKSKSSSPNTAPHDHPSAFVSNPYLEKVISEPGMGRGLHPDHVKHCFDYLRQAFMCAADSNLEDIQWVDGIPETTGWAGKRVCRDYEGLKDWTATWRTMDSDGIE